MEQFEATGNYYLISHLTLITGLSDRTIRNYIANGTLKGEKINGLWHFTPEEVEIFIRNPTVMPSIQAKHNAVIFDFLFDRKKSSEESCIVLDLPGHDPKDTAEYFCYAITNGTYKNIRFTFNRTLGVPRVILRGKYRDIQLLTGHYFDQMSNNCNDILP